MGAGGTIGLGKVICRHKQSYSVIYKFSGHHLPSFTNTNIIISYHTYIFHYRMQALALASYLCLKPLYGGLSFPIHDAIYKFLRVRFTPQMVLLKY
jgi:hypothetical protein